MSITVTEFVEFLDSYKDNYLNSISKISKPREDNNSNDCRVDSDLDPLIRSNLPMLDFDTMCCESSSFDKNNRPSTVDALYYRVNQNGKLILYLIEFKGSNLDWDNNRSFKELDRFNEGLVESFKGVFEENNILDFNEVIDLYYSEIHKRIKHLCNHNVNKIEFSLRLKAFESIFMVLPSIYREYCEDNNETLSSSSEILTSDVLEFFESSSCEIQLLVVGKIHNENKSRYNNKILSSKIRKQYSRLKKYSPNTVKYFDIFNKPKFYKFLNELDTGDDLKTLND